METVNYVAPTLQMSRLKEIRSDLRISNLFYLMHHLKPAWRCLYRLKQKTWLICL